MRDATLTASHVGRVASVPSSLSETEAKAATTLKEELREASVLRSVMDKLEKEFFLKQMAMSVVEELKQMAMSAAKRRDLTVDSLLANHSVTNDERTYLEAAFGRLLLRDADFDSMRIWCPPIASSSSTDVAGGAGGRLVNPDSTAGSLLSSSSSSPSSSALLSEEKIAVVGDARDAPVIGEENDMVNGSVMEEVD